MIRTLDHVGLVVQDLEATTDFLVRLGLRLEGTARNEGPWVDAVLGLEGVRSEIAYLRAPGGGSAVEVSRFDHPVDDHPPRADGINRLGLRHLAFEVDDLDGVLDVLREAGDEVIGEVVRYADVYRLCFVRGPEGLLVELAEPLGG